LFNVLITGGLSIKKDSINKTIIIAVFFKVVLLLFNVSDGLSYWSLDSDDMGTAI